MGPDSSTLNSRGPDCSVLLPLDPAKIRASPSVSVNIKHHMSIAASADLLNNSRCLTGTMEGHCTGSVTAQGLLLAGGVLLLARVQHCHHVLPVAAAPAVLFSLLSSSGDCSIYVLMISPRKRRTGSIRRNSHCTANSAAYLCCGYGSVMPAPWHGINAW